MSDFSLTQVYVLDSDNTLPSPGTYMQSLTSGQVGVFGPDYNAVNSSTITSVPYIYVAQGKLINLPMTSTPRTDKIYTKNIIDWYKVTAEPIATLQITQVNGFSFLCDQDINLTLRLFSNYINAAYFNGLTRTVTVRTPCCECGEAPCDTVSPDDVVTALANKINAEPVLSKYVTANKTGTGDTATLTIYGKQLDIYGNECVLPAFPYEYDRMDFYTFLYSGPETTQDYVVYDRCDIPGTVTVLQRATYVSGSSSEVKQMEKNYWSYNTLFKHIFFNPLYNGAFVSNVVDGTFYDMFVIKFKSPDLNTWAATVPQDETVIMFVPTGTSASSNLETLLEAYNGDFDDHSQSMLTTTTTTSTTSTTTTTTTTLFP